MTQSQSRFESLASPRLGGVRKDVFGDDVRKINFAIDTRVRVNNGSDSAG